MVQLPLAEDASNDEESTELPWCSLFASPKFVIFVGTRGEASRPKKQELIRPCSKLQWIYSLYCFSNPISPAAIGHTETDVHISNECCRCFHYSPQPRLFTAGRIIQHAKSLMPVRYPRDLILHFILKEVIFCWLNQESQEDQKMILRILFNGRLGRLGFETHAEWAMTNGMLRGISSARKKYISF